MSAVGLGQQRSEGGFPHQVFHFGPVRQNFFREYRDAPPPSYARKFSILELFLKHREGFP